MNLSFFQNLFLLFLIVGCASSPIKSVSTLTVSDFLIEQEERERSLASVEGKLHIRYRIKQEALNGTARLAIENEKSRLEVSDPVGRLRFWLVAKNQETHAFYEDEKSAYLSRDGGKSYFQKMFLLDVSTQELNGLWMGIVPKKWREKMEGKWELVGDLYQGRIKWEDKTIDLWVSPEKKLLTQLSWVRAGKGIKLVIDDFDACCSFQGRESLLGHHVVFYLAEEPDQIVLDWVELNRLAEKQNPLKFVPTLPKGTKVIHLNKSN